MIDTGRESGVLDFTEMAAGNVVDKAAYGEGLGNPGMGAELLQLVADIFFDVLERVEEGGEIASVPARFWILVRRSCSVVCIRPQSVWLMTMNSSVPSK